MPMNQKCFTLLPQLQRLSEVEKEGREGGREGGKETSEIISPTLPFYQ